jgi:ribonuclease D
MPTPAEPIVLVATQSDLEAACAAISAHAELGLDTEFARTDTYRPKLCLVQIGTPARVFCVDMLAGLDTAPLWQVLGGPGAVKVLHAAKQDIEVLCLTFAALPAPIFDTQIAAGLLGYPPQAGYAALVETELGMRLDKTQTRTDWSKRPLSPAQIEYAANDVAHLPALADRLRLRLAASGRLEWAREDTAALLDPAIYGVRPETAWERLPGLDYQPIAVQARARRLAAWREQRADQANRPRQWILSNQALMALAAANPADAAALSALDLLSPGTMRNSGPAILGELRRAEADLAAGALRLNQQSRPAPLDNERVSRLGAVVQKVAGELGIAQEILATRAELAALLRGSRDVRPLRGWRHAVVGEALLAAL